MYNILHHFPVWLSIKLVCVEGQGERGTLNFFFFWGGATSTLDITYHIQCQCCFFTLTKKLFSLKITATAVVTHLRDNYYSPLPPLTSNLFLKNWRWSCMQLWQGSGAGEITSTRSWTCHRSPTECLKMIFATGCHIKITD